MYIVITSIFLILALLFWDTIKIMLKTMSSSNIENGYLWFFCLLGINVIVIAFIYGFYYYKINQEGKRGLNGVNGFPGIEGEACSIDTPCYKTNF
jgi:hypothetical protein